MGGKIGVDIFVLISGYFLVSSVSIKVEKAIKLWLQIFTYSVVLFAVFVGSGIEPFRIKELIKDFLPITYSQSWFASTYFVLYLISPYINKFLKVLNKKEYQRFLVLLTVCWCIIPTFLGTSWQANSLLWFVYLYALAAYVRLHACLTSTRGSTYIMISLVVMGLTFLSVVLFDIIGMKIPLFGIHSTYFYKMEKLPILIASLMLFIGFLKIDIKYNAIINMISSTTFGIYLIHDNKYVRPFLWKTIFENAKYEESVFLIPYSIAVVILVFVVCFGIELFRIHVIEKRYLRMVKCSANIFTKYLSKFFSFRLFDIL